MRRLFSRLTAPVLELPRTTKRIVAVMVDMSLCVLTVWLAYYMRLGEFVTSQEINDSSPSFSLGNP